MRILHEAAGITDEAEKAAKIERIKADVERFRDIVLKAEETAEIEPAARSLADEAEAAQQWWGERELSREPASTPDLQTLHNRQTTRRVRVHRPAWAKPRRDGLVDNLPSRPLPDIH